jgi:hypothetical protein
MIKIRFKKDFTINFLKNVVLYEIYKMSIDYIVRGTNLLLNLDTYNIRRNKTLLLLLLKHITYLSIKH